MNFKQEIQDITLTYLHSISKDKNIQIEKKDIVINITDSKFEGDYTIVLFGPSKKIGMSPVQLADGLGEYLKTNFEMYLSHNLVNGFFNISIQPTYWNQSLSNIYTNVNFGIQPEKSSGESIMIEYPSPNTNKPLHLGHLRNIFLGSSLVEIMKANGHQVHRVCLYNDRGTNISKSMWSYLKSSDKKTPENSNIKGDHLVGDYYVDYSNQYKAEITSLKEKGLTEEEAKKQSLLEKEVADLTVKWENNDTDTRALWNTMNGWFYDGVKQTYQTLNLTFDQEYYESNIYDKGKETVKEGLEKNIFFQKEDSSVWIDLTDVGLDQKLVLRSNGTTVYITQDIALAYQKQTEFQFSKSIYVVGNEQDYHFKVLFEILRRLGLKASKNLYHLSYGMVELPTGKMKSREGTVVDADDILTEVTKIAKEKANEQGKLSEISDEAKETIYAQIGIGALRYFILKVDPVKKMIYNPEDSIDFNGNTAPFIQYIYARTCSLSRNAIAMNVDIVDENETFENYIPNSIESKLIRTLSEFEYVVKEAGNNYSPALIANYVYQVASDFSTFYHDYKVLKEEDILARSYRLYLSKSVGQIIKSAMKLLCIDVPERM